MPMHNTLIILIPNYSEYSGGGIILELGVKCAMGDLKKMELYVFPAVFN